MATYTDLTASIAACFNFHRRAMARLECAAMSHRGLNPGEISLQKIAQDYKRIGIWGGDEPAREKLADKIREILDYQIYVEDAETGSWDSEDTLIIDLGIDAHRFIKDKAD